MGPQRRAPAGSTTAATRDALGRPAPGSREHAVGTAIKSVQTAVEKAADSPKKDAPKSAG